MYVRPLGMHPSIPMDPPLCMICIVPHTLYLLIGSINPSQHTLLLNVNTNVWMNIGLHVPDCYLYNPNYQHITCLAGPCIVMQQYHALCYVQISWYLLMRYSHFGSISHSEIIYAWLVSISCIVLWVNWCPDLSDTKDNYDLMILSPSLSAICQRMCRRLRRTYHKPAR